MDVAGQVGSFGVGCPPRGYLARAIPDAYRRTDGECALAIRGLRGTTC